MLILINPHSGVPVFRQLMDQIRFHVASGLLKPGDELPSTRALSTELGVNPMTVSKAYSLLERESVLERRPGRNLLVRPAAPEEMEGRKLDQLRESLSGVVRIIRQLGISREEALRSLAEMIDDDPSSPDSTTEVKS